MPETHLPTILVVDDEDLIRWSLGQVLTKQGYEVLAAENGEIGLNLFQEHAPKLVLLDLKLPDVDGLDLLTRLLAENRDVSVIVMTAYGSPSLEQQARRLGAVDFLRKPFPPVTLCQRIKAILANGTTPDAPASGGAPDC